MRKWLIGFVIVLAIFFASLARGDTVYKAKTKDFVVLFTDAPCGPPLSLAIVPDARPSFKVFTYEGLTEEGRSASNGQRLVKGCWTEDEEWTEKGTIGFVNEFGVAGMVDKTSLKRVNNGVKV
jgi:hypothetical protein